MPRLVHIGAGGFNRSHLAVYLDDLLGMAGEPRWEKWRLDFFLPTVKSITG